MKAKKNFYILCFSVFGLLLGFLVHGIVEIIYIKFSVLDYDKYSFGLSWSDLLLMHDFFAILMIAILGLWGYKSGQYWWHYIYELKKLRWKPWF